MAQGRLTWLIELDNASKQNAIKEAQALGQQLNASLNTNSSSASNASRNVSQLSTAYADLRQKLISLRNEEIKGERSAEDLRDSYNRLETEIKQVGNSLAGTNADLNRFSTLANGAALGSKRLARELDASEYGRFGTNMMNGAKGVMQLRNALVGLGAGYASSRVLSFTREAALAYATADAQLKIYDDTLRVFNQNQTEGATLLNDLAVRFKVTEETVAQAATPLLRMGANLDQVQVLLERGGASALAFGRSTKEGFENVASAVVSQRSVNLNSIGITKDLGAANLEMARSLDKTTAELTQQEKIQAAVNLVLSETNEEYAKLDVLQAGVLGTQQDLNKQAEEAKKQFGLAASEGLSAFNQGLADFLAASTIEGGLVDTLGSWSGGVLSRIADDFTAISDALDAISAERSIPNLLRMLDSFNPFDIDNFLSPDPRFGEGTVSGGGWSITAPMLGPENPNAATDSGFTTAPLSLATSTSRSTSGSTSSRVTRTVQSELADLKAELELNKNLTTFSGRLDADISSINSFINAISNPDLAGSGKEDLIRQYDNELQSLKLIKQEQQDIAKIESDRAKEFEKLSGIYTDFNEDFASLQEQFYLGAITQDELLSKQYDLNLKAIQDIGTFNRAGITTPYATEFLASRTNELRSVTPMNMGFTPQVDVTALGFRSNVTPRTPELAGYFGLQSGSQMNPYDLPTAAQIEARNRVPLTLSPNANDTVNAELIRQAFGVGNFGTNESDDGLAGFFSRRNQASARAFPGNPFNETPAINNLKPNSTLLPIIDSEDGELAGYIMGSLGIANYSRFVQNADLGLNADFAARNAALASAAPGNPFNETAPIINTRRNAFNLPAGELARRNRIAAQEANIEDFSNASPSTAGALDIIQALNEANAQRIETEKEAAENFKIRILEAGFGFADSVTGLLSGQSTGGQVVSQGAGALGGLIGLGVGGFGGALLGGAFSLVGSLAGGLFDFLNPAKQDEPELSLEAKYRLELEQRYGESVGGSSNFSLPTATSSVFAAPDWVSQMGTHVDRFGVSVEKFGSYMQSDSSLNNSLRTA